MKVILEPRLWHQCNGDCKEVGLVCHHLLDIDDVSSGDLDEGCCEVQAIGGTRYRHIGRSGFIGMAVSHLHANRYSALTSQTC